MSKVVLYQPWGGLGDNLQFSTLPELYAKNGVDFYISHQNAYRNDEIKNLVWDLNPYVKGISMDTPDIGVNSTKQIIRDSFIQRIEESNGFINTGNKYPVIYYEPNFIEELKDMTIISFNSVSVLFENPLINEIITKLNGEDNVLVLDFVKTISNSHIKYVDSNNIYFVNDIFHHCDIIASCKRYITLFSGSSVLASAIISKTNNRNTEVILDNNYVHRVFNEKLYYFDNLKYIY